MIGMSPASGERSDDFVAAALWTGRRLEREQVGETLKTPVALFVFNRPETTARVFSAIRGTAPSKLFVVADGPRPDRPGEADLCDAARSVAAAVDWECDVRKLGSDINLGCRRRMSSGLDWLFEQVDEAIILEDDCLPHPTFFPFCEELLARYLSLIHI